MGFHKLPWRTVNHRDYKHFDNENFTQDICKFNFSTSKSSCLRKFFEIAVLKNFAIFTGKHSFYKKRLQQSSLLLINTPLLSIRAFFQKPSRNLKLQAFQLIRTMKVMTLLKSAQNYFENYPSIVKNKRKGFDTDSILEKLMKLLNLSKLWI